MLLFLFFASFAASGPGDLDSLIDGEIADLLKTYTHLHAHPELSYREKETSAFVADKLHAMGFLVKEDFGRYEDPDLTCHGLVAVMKNGDGPTLLMRTDFDALPVEEQTGLPYASRIRVEKDGAKVPVMHACGHDIHMSCFLGAAKILP